MAEEVWMLQTKKPDFKQIGARFRIDPVTARIISALLFATDCL